MKSPEENLIKFPDNSGDDQLPIEGTCRHDATSNESCPMSGLYSVILCELGGNKIAVIKAIREIVFGLDLAEAKRLVESPPLIVAERKPRMIADRIKSILEEAGATAKLQLSPTVFHLNREPNRTDSEGASATNSRFTVILEDYGDNKIAVIRTVCEIRPGLGLAEAKRLVESAPVAIAEDTSQLEAEDIRNRLQDAHAIVRVEPLSSESCAGSYFQSDDLSYLAAKSFKLLFEQIESTLRAIIDRLEQLAGENALTSSCISPLLETSEMKSIDALLDQIEGVVSSFDVILRDPGCQPIPYVIKTIRQYVPGTSLHELLQMVHGANSVVMENASRDAAEGLHKALADAGAIASIRGHFSASKIALIRQTIGRLHDPSASVSLSDLKGLFEAFKERSITTSDVFALIQWKFEDAIEAELSRLENVFGGGRLGETGNPQLSTHNASRESLRL